jgi:predicted protein tyrosine phosphatase
MAKLIIAGIYDLADKIAQHQPDLVVSITDPDAEEAARVEKALVGHDRPVVKLAFHDIDVLTKGYVAPNPSHLRQVAKALDEHLPRGDGTVLIHCSAGVSRSPAVGLFALGYLAKQQLARGVSSYDVFQQWRAAAGDCEPNRRILMMFSSELGPLGRVLAEMAIDHTQKTKIAQRRQAGTEGVW